jgi:hypothetical protein
VAWGVGIGEVAGGGGGGEEQRRGDGEEKARQDFFFEKKKQKTFATWRTRPTSKQAARANEKKFFGSFFQKRTFFLPCFTRQKSPAT